MIRLVGYEAAHAAPFDSARARDRLAWVRRARDVATARLEALPPSGAADFAVHLPALTARRRY